MYYMQAIWAHFGTPSHLQHGFRSGRSCETQLVTNAQQKGSQIDIAVLDFSKAFVTVPHDGLLSKLKHYGIDKFGYGFIWKQSVVVDGKQSSLMDVISGVPQGTVLGPLDLILFSKIHYDIR